MKQSRLFTKTRKEAPRDEEAKNAQLLIRAGFVHKEMAGVYVFLPLGVRVLKKIEAIIREEMEGLHILPVQSSLLQKKEVWEKTRWSDEEVDNWFKTTLKNGTPLGLAFSHEEPLTAMMKNYIQSYKDLPTAVYDFRTILRNEKRAKSGLMRGREFFWKAAYSFSRDEEEHQIFYEQMKDAYKRIFQKLGLGAITYLTFASGGSFSRYSHEFQTLSDAGEDIIYLDEEQGIAVNQEVFRDDVLKDLGLKKEHLVEKKAIEVGNIFSLAEKFSQPLDLSFQDAEGKRHYVYMGSYGIGITRLIGTIAEVLSDEKGLVWPESIAPFRVHLLVFGQNENLFREAENLYHDLKNAGIEVLFDDRDLGPGQKLQDADLIGIPYRLVVSEKAAANGGIELLKRKSGDLDYLAPDRVISYLANEKES